MFYIFINGKALCVSLKIVCSTNGTMRATSIVYLWSCMYYTNCLIIAKYNYTLTWNITHNKIKISIHKKIHTAKKNNFKIVTTLIGIQMMFLIFVSYIKIYESDEGWININTKSVPG